MMDFKEAARIAKDFIAELYANESVTGIGLEEIELEPDTGLWSVTVGYNPSDTAIPLRADNSAWEHDFRSHYFGNRRFKLVKVRDRDGIIMSIRDRFFEPADA